jgi:dipeptidyl-peptidase-4
MSLVTRYSGNHRRPRRVWAATLLALSALAGSGSLAQDRLKTMPGYERYQFMRQATTNAVKSGQVRVDWKDEGRALEYSWDGKRYRVDVATGAKTALTNSASRDRTNAPTGRRRQSGENVERGRQFTKYTSPDGQWNATHRAGNVWLTATNATNGIAITTEANGTNRLKFGTASWVYGEELDQNSAMWWAPHSRKLAFYRFDESAVRDFYLTLDLTKVQSTLDREAYPKAGATNPVADVLIYDLETKRTITVNIRDGQPPHSHGLGHYVYGVSWTKDSRELLLHRTDRLQKSLELVAADPESGNCRVVVREEWPESWTENSPTMRFLEDGRRFLWASERTGWRNYYLCSLDTNQVIALTRHEFEVGDIVRVDEKAGLLHYLARSGDNPMKLQMHRVRLDGTGDVRLTDPAFHHTVDFAPDGRHFTDVAQTHNQPPVTTLRTADGAPVAELARSDLTKFKQLGMRPVELLQFKAADGVTDLYGLLHFPSKFSRLKKYPLLVSVYAGPATTGARETFVTPSLLTEYGFLVASFDSRSANGRGKRFLDTIYQNLGRAEIDDQAAGVKALWSRRYLDRQRVGIFGTSYGGTASALCLLRYPEVFQAACANSTVTDFRHYDSIYTERYLGLPQDHPAVYDATSAVKLAGQLRGRLMIFYGTADNNVHPNNSLQLIEALQRAGKSFEVQVGPDQGHTAVNQQRMMEFFIEHLVLDKPRRN